MEFYFSNFRQFKKLTRFPIRDINIILGPNGSGKSTISKVLKLLSISDYVWGGKKDFIENNLKRIEFYRLLKTSKEECKVGITNEFYYKEFIFKKLNNYITIKSYEAGLVNEFNIKEQLFCWQPDLPSTNSKDFEDVKDFVKELVLNSKRDFYNYKEIFSDIEEKNQKLFGFFYNLSDEFLLEIQDNFPKEFGEIGLNINQINKNLLGHLLTQYRELIQYFIEKNKEPNYSNTSHKPSRYLQRLKRTREIPKQQDKNDPLESFILRYGVNEFKKISIDDFFRHIILAYFSLDCINILDGVHGLPPAKISVLEETRPEPPDFFEVVNGNVVNDYFDIFQFATKLSDKNIILNDQHYIKRFIKYLKIFDVADDIGLKKVGFKEPNTEYYIIVFKKNKINFMMKNLSSGGKQILPVLIRLLHEFSTDINFIKQPELTLQKHRIIFESKADITFIRQPELHLHPKLQMLIPEIICEISFDDDFPRIFFIETHSEHIVRKFQLLVAQNKEKPTKENISFLYVESDKSGIESTVKVMELDETGNFVENWPSGFFDEAAELSLLLLEAQIKRNN